MNTITTKRTVFHIKVCYTQRKIVLLQKIAIKRSLTLNITTLEKKEDYIDIRDFIKDIKAKKKLYFTIVPCVLILSSIYIFSKPRYYTTETTMAPELSGSMSTGALGSIASSFGIDINDMQTSDAITPYLYPNLMDDNGFVAKTFNIKVESKDKDIKTDYYTYLKKYQKHSWMENCVGAIKKVFTKKKPGKPTKFNPYAPSKDDDAIMEQIRDKIKLTIDKKNGIISISATAQDPVICKTLADSVRSLLQNYITEYRTNKAKADYEYYKNLTEEAKESYERQRQKYGSYADANTDVILESVKAKQEDLENDLQLKYNTYSTLVTQMQAAQAKVREKTPVFTLLKGASVPIKPSGPKRMIFLLGMMFLTCLFITLYIAKDTFTASFIAKNN